MKVSVADRRHAYVRALVWLVDECNGSAPALEMGKVIIGTTKGGPIQSTAFTLHRMGWVLIIPGPDQRTRSSRLQVTPYGYLMRDYMLHQHEHCDLDRIEMHAQIKAMRAILTPLARAGVKYRDASTAQRDVLRIALEPLGLSLLQLDMAAAIIYPERGLDKLVFPWTPGYIGKRLRKIFDKGKGYADELAREFRAGSDSRRSVAVVASDPDRREVSNATAASEKLRANVADDRDVDGVRMEGAPRNHGHTEPSEQGTDQGPEGGNQ